MSTQAYRDAAVEKYEDDDINIDPDAKVSILTTNGDTQSAWVQAWVRVERDETNLCRNLQCNERVGDGGDGYDGFCGNCADKKERTA